MPREVYEWREYSERWRKRWAISFGFNLLFIAALLWGAVWYWLDKH